MGSKIIFKMIYVEVNQEQKRFKEFGSPIKSQKNVLFDSFHNTHISQLGKHENLQIKFLIN